MHSRRWLSGGAFLLILLASAVSSTRLRAQTPADDPDDEEKITPTLSVNARLQENGNAVISSNLLTQTIASSEGAKAALESSFHCTLSDSTLRVSTTGYMGTCHLPATANGLLRRYLVATSPLVAYAKQKNIELLQIAITLPDAEIRETVPAVKSFNFSSPKSSQPVTNYLAALRIFTWRVDSPIPESIEVRIGYDSAAMQRRGILLLAALLLPVFLALWLRRRALSAQVQDKSSIWFSYLRYQQWMLNGSLVLWWASCETAHAGPFIEFLVQNSGPRFSWLPALASTLLTWIPPALVWIVCVIISHPVQEQLRGLQWTRRELVLQSTYALTSALLPLLLAVKAIGLLTRGDFRVAILLIFASLLVKFIARAKLQKIMGMQPQALTTGELRDAAFGMAHRLGVKLQQIYVIPAGKSQMANAFARSGNTIAFTDYLLQRMSRREVNYILGHELSHLRLKHLQKLSYAFLGSLFAGIFLFTTFRAAFPVSPFLRFGLLFVIMTLVPYFWSRRFEFAADAGSVEATGDPEAAISALFKLASLNMHPLHWGKWSEKWLTHPSTLRRAQAVARKAAIPVERLPKIARAAVQTDAHYVVPASAIAGNKILSTSRKTGNAVQGLLAMLSAIILTPTAVALFIKFTHFSWPVQRLIYLGGLAAAVAAYFAARNFLPVGKLRELIPQLKAKVQAEGVQPDAWNAVTVGLAPGPVPRTYEGHTHWDVGFLFLRSDRICYWGEETRFALRRDQITEIKLGPSTPNLLRSYRVYIAWRDREGATCGVFSLGCLAPETVLAHRDHTKKLFAQLLQWHGASSPTRTVPAPLDSLSAPNFGSVTGISPVAVRKRSAVLKQLYLFGLLATAVAVVAGLPFHLLRALTLAPGPQPNGVGSGWYVVAVALAVIFLQYIPYFRYKDVPVLQASLGTKAAPIVRGKAEAESDVREPEPVNPRQ
jgi:Zn-dependent protease with chaperone function